MDLMIAWRNLWRNSRRTCIILTAIIIGIISMLVLSAFGRGSMQGMVNNSLDNLVGHIKIRHPLYRVDPVIDNRLNESNLLMQQLQSLVPEGTNMVQRIRVEGLLSTSRDHEGVEIVGIEPELERAVSFLRKPLYQGAMISADDPNGLLIGEELREKIGLDIGKKVVLLTQTTEGDSISRAFRIRGSYKTEMKETEKRTVFVNLDTLRQITGAARDATEISLRISADGIGSSTEITELSRAIGANIKNQGLEVSTWQQLLPAIHAYIAMFDTYMLIWFVVVFIAMGFGLANTMLMAVYERMREFGLQRALGMRSSRIVRVVLIEVLLLLLLGVLIANCSALVLTEWVFRGGIDLSVFAEGIEMWGISRIIYPVLGLRDVISANAVVVVLGLIVGLYPALQAARFTPVETMRHT
jgi:ABC-type lipoprotein release transport system permease subunit